MILIEKGGERQLVESLDGYDGWKVVERDVDRPPSTFAKREGGKWVEDTEAKEKAERNAKLEKMTRAELVDHILDEVRKL